MTAGPVTPTQRTSRAAGGLANAYDSGQLRRDLAGAALAAVLSLTVAAVALHLWSWHPSVPLSYSSDALYYNGVVKATVDHGWYLSNPDLGAPFGLDSYDFPAVSNDSLQLLIVKGLSLFTDRPFVVSNAFFLLCFPLNAIGAFGALRFRRTPRQLAILGAAAFGVLPLHFMKGMDYLFFLSAYMVPIGCALVLTVLADEPLLRRRPGVAGLRGWASGRTAALLLLAAAIASASLYYAVFTSILLVAAVVTRGCITRSWRRSVEGLAAVGAIGTFVALNQLPTILYRFGHGSNPLVAMRDPAETEYYGLRLIQMVLPVPGHRVGAFTDLTDRYRATSNALGEPSTSIGLLASIGLAWLLVVAVTRVAGPGRRAVGTNEERNAAFCVVVALLWATTGGVSALVSYTLTPQLRAWGRVSVFIAFFALIGALGLLNRLSARWPRARSRPIFVALLSAVLVLVALDQTSSRLTPDHLAIEREYQVDADFVASIEARMPGGSAILQLPYVAYPEVPATNKLGVYDELRPYLHSTRLRWSFAAMKGRPTDWHADVADIPLRSLLAGSVAGGFSGLVVDRFGYGDGGTALEAELSPIVGPPAEVGANLRMAFWDLRPLRSRLGENGTPMPRLAEATLRPVRLTWSKEFYPQESQAGERWRWLGERGVIDVHNPGPEPRQVILSMTVRTARPGTGLTTIRLPDGTDETITPAQGVEAGDGVIVRRLLRVPAGQSTVEVMSTAEPAALAPGDLRRLVVQLIDPLVVPVELCRSATVLGAPAEEGGCLDTSRAQLP